MNEELKSLIQNAAKLLGLKKHLTEDIYMREDEGTWRFFTPCNPESGDLMKVAQEARLGFDFLTRSVWRHGDNGEWSFENGDHQSLALAVLRAASAVLHSRGGV